MDGTATNKPDVSNLQWWTVREVANLLRYDPSTIRRWCETRKIAASLLPGGTWRIHKSVIDKLQADGLPEQRRQETAKVPTEFEEAHDYFDESPSTRKARA